MDRVNNQTSLMINHTGSVPSSTMNWINSSRVGMQLILPLVIWCLSLCLGKSEAVLTFSTVNHLIKDGRGMLDHRNIGYTSITASFLCLVVGPCHMFSFKLTICSRWAWSCVHVFYVAYCGAFILDFSLVSVVEKSSARWWCNSIFCRSFSIIITI